MCTACVARVFVDVGSQPPRGVTMDDVAAHEPVFMAEDTRPRWRVLSRARYELHRDVGAPEDLPGVLQDVRLTAAEDAADLAAVGEKDAVGFHECLGWPSISIATLVGRAGGGSTIHGAVRKGVNRRAVDRDPHPLSPWSQ